MERERSVELCLFSCCRPFPESRTSYFRFPFFFATSLQSESLEQATATSTNTPSSFKANYMVP